jgi:hypothetical protein
MELGELFLIDDPKLNLEQRVLWAAKRYQRKYGAQPTLCILHPSLLQGRPRRVGALRFEPKTSVLPNYLWLGADKGLRPLAR